MPGVGIRTVDPVLRCQPPPPVRAAAGCAAAGCAAGQVAAPGILKSDCRATEDPLHSWNSPLVSGVRDGTPLGATNLAARSLLPGPSKRSSKISTDLPDGQRCQNPVKY